MAVATVDRPAAQRKPPTPRGCRGFLVGRAQTLRQSTPNGKTAGGAPKARVTANDYKATWIEYGPAHMPEFAPRALFRAHRSRCNRKTQNRSHRRSPDPSSGPPAAAGPDTCAPRHGAAQRLSTPGLASVSAFARAPAGPMESARTGRTPTRTARAVRPGPPMHDHARLPARRRRPPARRARE